MILTLRLPVNHTKVSGLSMFFLTMFETERINPSQNTKTSAIYSQLCLMANQQDINYHSLIYHIIV